MPGLSRQRIEEAVPGFRQAAPARAPEARATWGNHMVQHFLSAGTIQAKLSDSDLPVQPLPLDPDARVRYFIDDALKRAGGATSAQNLSNAWRDLYSLREQNCGEICLGAAEHYMYARSEVAAGGTLTFLKMKVLIPLYTAGKIISSPLGLPKSGRCRPLPPSYFVMSWGYRGADDGLSDYKRLQRKNR